jgi:magnesium-transporting ATPase (P-type)
MSVMVRILGADNMEIYSKGAPEKIATMCKKNTGISHYIVFGFYFPCIPKYSRTFCSTFIIIVHQLYPCGRMMDVTY